MLAGMIRHRPRCGQLSIPHPHQHELDQGLRGSEQAWRMAGNKIGAVAFRFNLTAGDSLVYCNILLLHDQSTGHRVSRRHTGGGTTKIDWSCPAVGGYSFFNTAPDLVDLTTTQRAQLTAGWAASRGRPID